MNDARYPIGKFEKPGRIDAGQRAAMIEHIEKLPADLNEAVVSLDDAQLDTPYREGGWSVRQVVHHLADSHLNAFVRFKLALTEVKPQIKPYDQDGWALTADVSQAPIKISLDLLAAIHARWVLLLRSMNEEDFKREFLHPESGIWPLDQTLALYDWHSRHHLAHIRELKRKKNW